MSRVAFAVLVVGLICLPVYATSIAEVASTITLEAENLTLDLELLRRQSVEQIPFLIEYALEIPEGWDCSWLCIETEQEISGSRAQFITNSNAITYSVRVTVRSPEGMVYVWIDEDIDFPLHSDTDIVLDASLLLLEDESAKVEWTAANGDPADAGTFPILEPDSARTTLVSEWPNVLQVDCQIERPSGEIEAHRFEALVYFRDGTPFSKRGTAATVFVPASSKWQFASILDTMFTDLASLGFNTITTALIWWYGFPDEDGNFRIHPIPADYGWQGDSRGGTISDDALRLLLLKASEHGFGVNVELRQYNYRNNPELAGQYHASGWGANGFRSTDGFLYGAGEGLEAALRYYIPILAEYQVNAVFLGAEVGNIEAQGGEKSRAFYEGIISDFRDAGYGGDISYALAFYNGCGDYDGCPVMNDQNLAQDECGIPWPSMDYVGLTCYPSLAENFTSTTEEMLEVATEFVNNEMLKLHRAYDLPLFIEDMYCFGHDGCGKYPVHRPWVQDGEYDPEEQRRWHTAMLRALSNANLGASSPWIEGVTLYEYTLDPWALRTVEAWELKEKTWMNTPQRSDLRNLARVFFTDSPVSD